MIHILKQIRNRQSIKIKTVDIYAPLNKKKKTQLKPASSSIYSLEGGASHEAVLKESP
jgi:hypothetical protein